MLQAFPCFTEGNKGKINMIITKTKLPEAFFLLPLTKEKFAYENLAIMRYLVFL